MENRKRTIINLFEESVLKYGAKEFLLEKHNGKFEPTTYGEAHKEALRTGAGLVAMGIERGDRVAILAEGCNNWIISELGLLYAGAISVPLSIKLEEANDLLFRLKHSDSKLIFVSKYQIKKVRSIVADLPDLKQIVVWGDVDGGLIEGEISLEELKAKGDDYLKENAESFRSIAELLKNDDIATITYTSGTTADPKGVVLTHRNYTANVEQSLSVVNIPSSWRTLIILPLDHCFAHVVGFYIMIACGATVATTEVGRTPMETLKNIPLNIKEVRPHFLLSVPALAKNFRKSIETSIRKKGKTTERLFNLALKTSYAYQADGYTKGRGWRCLLKPAVMLFDKILYSKVREGFGGELQFFIGGGALLDSELQRFFYAVGMPMFQGYGLSEATPVISTNAPTKGNHRFGSSGRLVQPLEIKIMDSEGKELPVGEKGEIVIKGENVMAGYWKNPDSTADTVRDGWLYTGDMGYMGKDNFLYVLGRFKSLLISSDGEKYSPEGMEEAMVDKSPLIDQIMIYNNQNPYTIALVVASKEGLNRKLDELGLSGDARYNEAAKLLGAEIAKYRKGGVYGEEFPDRWVPAVITFADEAFTEQNGLVNSTMKVVRNKVEKHFASNIEHAYTAEGKAVDNEKNIASLKRILG
ncbi:MAG: AMP-binding protein [Alistipes sp.]|nr:AMP-binding protein [Alistipes sp.]